MTGTSYSEGRLPLGSEVVKGFLAPSSASSSIVSKSSGYHANASGFHVNSVESGAFEGLVPDSLSAVSNFDNTQMEDEMTRDELQAHLAKNKAEVDSVASSMRADMAQWRELNNTQMSALQAQLSSLNSKIDGKFEGMEGKIDGLKTTSATVQWMVGAILALLAIVFALPFIQPYVKPEQQIETPLTPQIQQPSQQPSHSQPKNHP